MSHLDDQGYPEDPGEISDDGYQPAIRVRTPAGYYWVTRIVNGVMAGTSAPWESFVEMIRTAPSGDRATIDLGYEVAAAVEQWRAQVA